MIVMIFFFFWMGPLKAPNKDFMFLVMIMRMTRPLASCVVLALVLLARV